MKPQVPDPKYRMPNEALPEAVQDLWMASNRPVLKPECLFFRESNPTIGVPDLQPWGTMHASLRLEHRIFYLWQGDGSLAVYAYLFDGSSAAGRSYGCLYVGCVKPEDWTLGGAA